MKTTFEKMMRGLDEVETYLTGEGKGFKVYVPREVDVKAIRNRLGWTQSRFSDVFGFSLDSIKNWESKRRQPEAAARVLLTVIKNDPTAVIAALHPAQQGRRRSAQPKQHITRAGKLSPARR